MDVLTAAYNLVADYPGGSVALAPQLGKSHTTLSHELNRNYPGAKLGLLDAVKLSVLSGDARVADAFAREMGGIFLPLLAGGGSLAGTLSELAQLACKFGELVQETNRAWADGQITANELAVLEREAGELSAAMGRVLAHARADCEARNRDA
ncbi:MAG: phage regulatory CII family protein [Inhella sp.]